jgi:hypothetical protein
MRGEPFPEFYSGSIRMFLPQRAGERTGQGEGFQGAYSFSTLYSEIFFEDPAKVIR